MNLLIDIIISLGPIDCKSPGHGQNDGFVLYEFRYIINNMVVFANVMKKKIKENNMSTLNRLWVPPSFVSHFSKL